MRWLSDSVGNPDADRSPNVWRNRSGACQAKVREWTGGVHARFLVQGLLAHIPRIAAYWVIYSGLVAAP
jgi:hypothetical protein